MLDKNGCYVRNFIKFNFRKYMKYWNWSTKYHSLFRLKLVYSYVIEVADSEYQLHLQHNAQVLKIQVFSQIKLTIIIKQTTV